MCKHSNNTFMTPQTTHIAQGATNNTDPLSSASSSSETIIRDLRLTETSNDTCHLTVTNFPRDPTGGLFGLPSFVPVVMDGNLSIYCFLVMVVSPAFGQGKGIS